MNIYFLLLSYTYLRDIIKKLCEKYDKQKEMSNVKTSNEEILLEILRKLHEDMKNGCIDTLHQIQTCWDFVYGNLWGKQFCCSSSKVIFVIEWWHHTYPTFRKRFKVPFFLSKYETRRCSIPSIIYHPSMFSTNIARKLKTCIIEGKYCVNRVYFQYWRCSLLASRWCKIQNHSGAEPLDPPPPPQLLPSATTRKWKRKETALNISLEKNPDSCIADNKHPYHEPMRGRAYSET